MNTHIIVANPTEVQLRVTFEADSAEIKALVAQLSESQWPSCDLKRTLVESINNLESRSIWAKGKKKGEK